MREILLSHKCIRVFKMDPYSTILQEVKIFSWLRGTMRGCENIKFSGMSWRMRKPLRKFWFVNSSQWICSPSNAWSWIVPWIMERIQGYNFLHFHALFWKISRSNSLATDPLPPPPFRVGAPSGKSWIRTCYSLEDLSTCARYDSLWMANWGRGGRREATKT